MARAFDAVHGQAVRLAAEQAALQANVSAMFVNLSRRSQALVERQLQLIEALESNEQDADQLSNLFQLDHLATRMRRNSENLLVLAGTDLAKRNMAPVPVVDVLRAAVSEVEQYQRVVVQAPPAASIAGRAGLRPRPPAGRAAGQRHDVLPAGVAGGHEHHPRRRTARSSSRSPTAASAWPTTSSPTPTRASYGPSGVDVSASRRMGLFVVGRLAARHGIGVRLASTAAGPGSGLTASVSVPPSLIPTGVPADAPRPAGVPMPAGIPAQGRPAEARPQRPDANGARPGSAVCAGHGGGRARQRTARRARRVCRSGGQSTLFAGKPPVNGTTTHGLPTRRPGSSLRPDGPPPTEAPPGGFFDDGGHGEGGRARTAAARTAPARPASRPGSTRRPPPAATGWPGGRVLVPPCRSPQPAARRRTVGFRRRAVGVGRRSRRPAAAHQGLHRVRRPSRGRRAPSDTPARDTAGPAGPARPGSPDTSVRRRRRRGCGRAGDGQDRPACRTPVGPTRRRPDTASERTRTQATAPVRKPRARRPQRPRCGQQPALRPRVGPLVAPTHRPIRARPHAPARRARPDRPIRGSSDRRVAIRQHPAGGFPSSATPSGGFPRTRGRPTAPRRARGRPTAPRSDTGRPTDPVGRAAVRPHRRPTRAGRPAARRRAGRRRTRRARGRRPHPDRTRGDVRPHAVERDAVRWAPAGHAAVGWVPVAHHTVRRVPAGARGPSTRAPAADAVRCRTGRCRAPRSRATPRASHGASGTEAVQPQRDRPGRPPGRGEATGGHTAGPKARVARPPAGRPRRAQDPAWPGQPAVTRRSRGDRAASDPGRLAPHRGARAGCAGHGRPPPGQARPSQGPGAQSHRRPRPAWGAGDQADDGTGRIPGPRPATRADTPPAPSPMPPTRPPRPPRAPTRCRAGSPGRRARPVRVRNAAAWPGPDRAYRTDQQAPPPEQYRSVSGTGGFPPRPAAEQPGGPAAQPRCRTRRTSCSRPACRPSTRTGSCPATTRTPARSTSARPHRSSRRSRRPGSGPTGRCPVSWESDTGSHPVVPPSTTDDTDPAGRHPSRWRPRRTGPPDGRRRRLGPERRGPRSAPRPTAGRPSADPPLRPTSWRTRAPTPRRRPGPPPVGGPAVRHAVAVRTRGRTAAVGAPTRSDTSDPARPARRPARRTPTRPAPRPRLPEPTPADFSTEADEGWLAASGAVAERPDELTAAGLPKRGPRARLIPGSAGSAVLAPAVTAARSAESISGRLASYQQGVRQGREIRLRRDPVRSGHGARTTPPRPTARQP